MYHCVRHRCAAVGSILVWITVIAMFKTTSIHYYDVTQQSIDSTSSALPLQGKERLEKDSTLGFNSIRNQIIPVDSSITMNHTTIEFYRKFVAQKNQEQFMYNSNLFSSETTRYILFVQVHKRIVYLKKFIQMLQAVETINETLVIFSHDFIDADINTLVTSITFVPVRYISI